MNIVYIVLEIDGINMFKPIQGQAIIYGHGCAGIRSFPFNFLFNGPSPNRPVLYLHSLNHQILNVAI